MSDQSYNNNGGNSGKNNSRIPWWVIVLSFCFGLWPIGIILLVLRLGQESGAFSSARGRQRYDQYHEQASRYASEVRQDFEDAARTVRDAANQVRQNFQNGTFEQRQNQQAEAQRRQAEQQRAEAQRRQQAEQQRAEAQKRQQAEQQRAEAQKRQQAEQQRAEAQKRQQAQQGGSSKLQQRLAKVKTGKLFSIIGGIGMGIFGLATVSEFLEDFSYLFYEPLWLVEDILPLFILTGVCAGMFTWGRFKKSQSKRYKRYLTLIGEHSAVSITALAEAYPAKRDAVCTTLENMISEGLLGEGAFIDYGRDMLVLDSSGVRHEPPKESAQRRVPETDIGEENALLREIREVNDAIKDPELSRKIDRIGEITERILEFQREHPEKSAELRKFLNYYLPTTLKILKSYAELEKQGIEGENIAATMQRIEGMMDMVVEGFERQLDKLFAGDMMDIAADITVMEQMMEGDGLFDKGGGDFGPGGAAGGS